MEYYDKIKRLVNIVFCHEFIVGFIYNKYYICTRIFNLWRDMLVNIDYVIS